MEYVNVNINDLPEQLRNLINGEGYFEIFTREKNKRFDTCFKVMVNNVKNNEPVGAGDGLKKIAQLAQAGLGNVNAADMASFISVGLNVANLCVSVAGFAMVLSELNNISNKMDGIANTLDKAISIQESEIIKSYKDAVNRYSNMVDLTINRKEKYGLNNYEKLISQLYLPLDQIYNLYMQDKLSDKETFFEAMFALAPLLSETIRSYDREYYFDNYGKVKSNSFNANSQTWINSIAKLGSDTSIDKFQEYFFFDKELSARDSFEIKDSIRKLMTVYTTDVDNNRKILSLCKEENDYRLINAYLNKISVDELKASISDNCSEEESIVLNNALDKQLEVVSIQA